VVRKAPCYRVDEGGNRSREEEEEEGEEREKKDLSRGGLGKKVSKNPVSLATRSARSPMSHSQDLITDVLLLVAKARSEEKDEERKEKRRREGGKEEKNEDGGRRTTRRRRLLPRFCSSRLLCSDAETEKSTGKRKMGRCREHGGCSSRTMGRMTRRSRPGCRRSKSEGASSGRNGVERKEGKKDKK
jgi:hypothetical protein